MKKQWWQDKVAYQIYPKSFMDSNGDGVGDLRGILSRLDYLKGLGIDIIWISPVYQSPMVDQGYDISDYQAIDPCFGSMEDMKELIAETKRRGMFLLMDLVVNHCSDQHIWFQKACEDPEGPYGQYFIIKKSEQGPLNNWQAEFGGSVWDLLPGHEDLYYFHTFAKEQPDLNWENPALREEIYRMVNWWLDLGISGFRIDAIINICKDMSFRDYPADRPDGSVGVARQLESVDGIGKYLSELKERCFVSHDAFTIGEVFDTTRERTREYIGPEGYFSTMFHFEPFWTVWNGGAWHEWKAFSMKQFRDTLFRGIKEHEDDAFFTNILENHDQPRAASYFIPKEDYGFASISALACIQLLLRGLPMLYQGQEIGMSNFDFQRVEELNDISSISQYEAARSAGLSEQEAMRVVCRFSRDNARTPMQWSSKAQAGFSSARPWRRVNPNYESINVAAQEEEYGSVLNFYRRLIAFRKSKEYRDLFAFGSFQPRYQQLDSIVAYERTYEKQRILLVCNFRNEETKLGMQEEGEVIFVNYPQVNWQGMSLCLKPYEVVVLELSPCGQIS